MTLILYINFNYKKSIVGQGAWKVECKPLVKLGQPISLLWIYLHKRWLLYVYYNLSSDFIPNTAS